MANHTVPGGGKLYDQFAPWERLVLLLEAMARGDDAETLLLRRSCPRKTYSGPDAAFDDRFALAHDTVAVVCGDLRALVAQIRVLHWAMENCEYFSALHHIDAEMAFFQGVRCGQGLPPSPDYSGGPEGDTCDTPETQTDDEETDLGPLGEDLAARTTAVAQRPGRSTRLILRLMRRAGEELAAELLAVWEAFGHFCTGRLGVSPERALGACGYPAGEELAEALKAYGHVKPDGKTAGEYRRLLLRIWDRQFGEGSGINE
jgi:hypothetical protein